MIPKNKDVNNSVNNQRRFRSFNTYRTDAPHDLLQSWSRQQVDKFFKCGD